MKVIIDTNVLLVLVRGNLQSVKINEQYDFFNPEKILIISVVTFGEIYAIAKKNNWGIKKIEKLKIVLNNFLITKINRIEIIEKYAEIDAFSQGKIDSQAKFSSRNMGKNDLWIAATASHYNLPFYTTDSDFDHLNKEYLDLNKIDLKDFK